MRVRRRGCQAASPWSPSTYSSLCRTSSINLVLCGRGAERALPLEVSRLGPSAGRICFTDDVDELGGRWALVGELTGPSPACTAVDPFCGGGTYRVVFDLLPGRCRAEIFRPEQPDWECLGLRVVAVGSGSLRSQDRC